MKRHLIWLPSGKKTDDNARPTCPAIPLPDGCNPNQLWVIRGFNNKDMPPPLTMPLIHNDTGWIEDIGHDWSVQQKHLIYRGRVSDGNCWLILVSE